MMVALLVHPRIVDADAGVCFPPTHQVSFVRPFATHVYGTVSAPVILALLRG